MNLDAIIASLGTGTRLVRHDQLDRPIASATDFAAAVGCPPARVFKTLLLRIVGDSTDYAGVVLPAPAQVDLDRVAHLTDAAAAALANRDELRSIRETEPMAVSPFHMITLPLFADSSLDDWPTVYVGSGRAGADIEVAPAALLAHTGARLAPVCTDTV